MDQMELSRFLAKTPKMLRVSVTTNCASGGKNFDELFVACMEAASMAVLHLSINGQPFYSITAGSQLRHT
jgi:hypothetical protein